MKRYCVTLMVVVALGGTVQAQDKADVELEKLEGAWVPQSFEFMGRTVSQSDRDRFVFSRDKKVVIKAEDKPDMNCIFWIDARKNPKEIDIIKLKDNKVRVVIKYIYQLEGDTLKLVIPQKKAQRPNEFDSKKFAILTLKRHKS